MTATATQARHESGPIIDAPTTNGTLVKRTAAVNEWDEGYKRLIVQTILRPKHRDPTPGEIAMFAEQVQRTGLDPFLKQIYGIYRHDSRAGGEVLQTQVGIDGFRLIAHRTRIYEGQDGPYWCGPDGVWRDVWLDAQGRQPSAAKVGVWMRGARGPVWGVTRFDAYAQRRDGALIGLWATMGDNQIAKCAEAQALRKAFPADLSGLYIPEEFDQASNAVDQMPVGAAATVLAANAVELITKKRAGELTDRTWDVDAQEHLQLAVASITGDDPGPLGSKTAATEALRKLTAAQASELERWLMNQADLKTANEETPGV